MKEKEKGGENNSKKEGGRIQNRKSWNCLYCDAKLKLIYRSRENNHNPNN